MSREDQEAQEAARLRQGDACDEKNERSLGVEGTREDKPANLISTVSFPRGNFAAMEHFALRPARAMTPAMIAVAMATFLATAIAESQFVTSDRNGGWSIAGYYVHNNMWNSAKYSPCTSTLYASSHDRWHVITRMNNQTGDGAVKTYPNVHKDYRSVPVSSFESLTSTFAEASPRVGIYNVAYDLWINGIAKPGCTEIMVWTENFKQVPGGRYVQDVVFGERTYRVYKGPSNSSYIAFVATANFTSGTVNLLEMVNWVIGKGWLSSNAVVDQVCFGVEMVSTDDADARFEVSAFSIEEQRRRSFKPF